MPHTLNINANLLAAMDDLSLLARTVVEGFSMAASQSVSR
jgi:hypothetical protein